MYRYYPSLWRIFVNQQRRFSIPGFREASVVDVGQIPKSNAKNKDKNLPAASSSSRYSYVQLDAPTEATTHA